MMERHSEWKHRITLLGSIPHHQVSSLYQRGHIFLNCSLTESFCIAILEAASCGLYVVSTNVGGIPEVLPSHLVTLAQPTLSDLVDKLSHTIEEYPNYPHATDPQGIHDNVKSLYSWKYVAQKTLSVYSHVRHNHKPLTFLQRLERYASVVSSSSSSSLGGFNSSVSSMTFQTMICFLYTIFHLYAQWIQRYWQPIHLIDIPFPNHQDDDDEEVDSVILNTNRCSGGDINGCHSIPKQEKVKLS